MPPLARWHVKLALVCLVAALVVGVAQGLPGAAATGLLPVYVHLLVVGWVTQMIFGVAYWMFPKHTKDRPRGHDALALAAFVFLNLGLLLRVVAEPWQARHPSAVGGWALVAAALLQLAAGVAFVANTWARVKER